MSAQAQNLSVCKLNVDTKCDTMLYYLQKRVMLVSQWDKLCRDILNKKKDLRFDDLAKALIKVGYSMEQPRGGSSHYTFRKPGCYPITIPKHQPMNRAYIELVSEVVKHYLEEES